MNRKRPVESSSVGTTATQPAHSTLAVFAFEVGVGGVGVYSAIQRCPGGDG